jgi:hypothetical protein
MCGKDANECTSKVGCGSGFLIFCGLKRDAEGKAVKDAGTGTAISQCVAQADCKVGQERVPVPTTKILDYRRYFAVCIVDMAADFACVMYSGGCSDSYDVHRRVLEIGVPMPKGLGFINVF